MSIAKEQRLGEKRRNKAKQKIPLSPWLNMTEAIYCTEEETLF